MGLPKTAVDCQKQQLMAENGVGRPHGKNLPRMPLFDMRFLKCIWNLFNSNIKEDRVLVWNCQRMCGTVKNW